MIDFEKVKFMLTIWGAGLSTILAILTFIKFRRESSIFLFVTPTIESPFDSLFISVVNNSSKAATIISYSVSIGMSKNYLKEFFFERLEVEKKLSDSDIWTQTINKNTLIKEVKRNQIKQKQFQRIWVSIHLSNGKIFSNPVYINPKLIENEYYKKAEQFIATDIFLGFHQMNSVFYEIGNK